MLSRAALAAALAGGLASGTPVPPCFEADMAYEDGARTSQLPNAGFWHAPEYCQKACKDQGYYCSYWTWQQHGDNAKGIAPGACWALRETAVLRKQVGSVAGPQTCPMSTISTSPSVLGAGSGAAGSEFIHTGAPTPSPAQPSGGMMPTSGSGGGSLVNGATTRKPALAGATAGSMAGAAAGGAAAGGSATAGSAEGGALPEGTVPEGEVISDAPPATSPPALPEGESSATAAPPAPPPPAPTTPAPEVTEPPATSAAPQEEVMTTLLPTIVPSTSVVASNRVWTGVGMIDSVCNFFADWFNWFSEVTGLSWWTMAFLTAFLCTFLALVAFCKHMHDSRKDKRKKKRSLHQHAMAEDDEEMQDMEDYGRSDPETYEEVTRPLINYQEAGRPIGGPAGPGALPTLHPPLPPGYPQPTLSRPQSQRRPQPVVSPMASPRAGTWRGLAPVPTTAVTTAAPVVQRPGAMALPLVQQITVRFPQRLRFF